MDERAEAHLGHHGSGHHCCHGEWHHAAEPVTRGHMGYCGCGRRFLTREERRERLERYLEQLKAEVRGVEEALADLKD